MRAVALRAAALALRPPERGENRAARGGGSEGDAMYLDVREEPERPPTKRCEALSPRPLPRCSSRRQ